MPWKRGSDTGFSYPLLQRIAGFPDAPECAVMETYGFLNALFELSAGHVTDYVVNTGMCKLAGGSRWRKLVGWATRAGLMTPVPGPVNRDVGPEWTLLDDPKFIHIRTQAELDAEARRRDADKKPHLTLAVRVRDGDNCRYCGIYVLWDGRRSNRSAVLDHRKPGEEPTSPDDMVIACWSCNSARMDNRHGWDAEHPLRPVPGQPGAFLTTPSYSPGTAEHLTKNGIPTETNVDHALLVKQGRGHRSKPAAAPRAARPAATRTAPRTTATDATDPEGPAAPPEPLMRPDEAVGPPNEPPPNPDPSNIGTGSAGSGRDGEQRRRKRGRRGSGKASTSAPSAPPHDEPDQPSGPSCCHTPFHQTDPDTQTTLCLTCGKEPTP